MCVSKDTLKSVRVEKLTVALKIKSVSVMGAVSFIPLSVLDQSFDVFLTDAAVARLWLEGMDTTRSGACGFT